jgi:hypothetical protein
MMIFPFYKISPEYEVSLQKEKGKMPGLHDVILPTKCPNGRTIKSMRIFHYEICVSCALYVLSWTNKNRVQVMNKLKTLTVVLMFKLLHFIILSVGLGCLSRIIFIYWPSFSR